jgi:hypothetical protein
MTSFFKRLFSGKPADANAPVATQPATQQPDPEAFLAETRHNAALYDRDADPQDWANAQQILASNICSLAAQQEPYRAKAMFAEAIDLLGEALTAAGPEAVPAFRASMFRLRGECAWRSSAHLTGDAKGQVLADGANWLGEAVTLCPVETNRSLWVDAQLFRGACLQDLALLKGGGDQSLAWLDEAAACFEDLADRGGEDGAVHPIGAYNAHVVLEQRAQATKGAVARTYFERALHRLVQAMGSAAFKGMEADSERRLAAIDRSLRSLPAS